MKTRDAAFIVDHRRQVATSAPPPSKNDEQTLLKKKKSTGAARTKQPNANAGVKQTPQMQSAVAAPTTKKATTTPVATKKNATKQQGKATKKEKQQAKQQTTSGKAGAKDTPPAASASSSNAAVTTRATALDQDGLKSRNHTLFLAPSCGATATAKSLPSWGNTRKDVSKSDSVTQRCVICGGSLVDDATYRLTLLGFLTGTTRLHAEILEYAQYTRHTVDDMAVHIEEMIANVRKCVQSLWPHSKVETFGSYSTGIWLPSSDVDLVILDVVEVNDVLVTVTNLRRLAKALEAQAWVHSLVLLDTAKIPVLKLVSADTTRVPIDITFESSATHSGLIARDLIKRYAQELPELYPLAVVFKQLLRERDLNDAYTGGLSSYSIVLMIIHFAQLWRNGDRCFQAASIYASGSLPPAPSSLVAETKVVDTKTESSAKTANTTSASDAGSPVKKQSIAAATPTSSYAAIVSSQPKQLTRSDSETQTGKKNENSATESAPVQRFSYAAVAAGIVKVSEDDAASKKNASSSCAPAAPPSSYAAAVAAAAGSKSSSTVVKKASSVLKSSTTTSSTSAGITETQLDAVSVTSSSADTEDSCSSSSSSSSSAADSDEEISGLPNQQQQRYVCLGEHTMMLLEFFGIIFDYRKNGLSIRDGGYIYRLADHPGSELSKPALVIEDPIHPDRNVSASSFAFSKVVAVFEDSYYALKYHRPTKFAPSALSCLLSSSGHTSHHSPPKSIASR
uniref:Polymerase nucleotidyl transferase domain-containing protein n=1 Tax=Globisporangium ultimum (strain ATCC 200006 / CBS 805.95 / DAOM BR144) TaxID=431595 RepID=K3WU88_GLOUD